MIQKLRRRFIIIMMSMVTVVLAVTFSVLVISSAQQLKAESFLELEDGYQREAMNNDEDLAMDTSELPINHNNDLINDRSPFLTFYVTVDEDGKVVSVDGNNNGIVLEDLQTAVSSVLSQDNAQGSLDDLSLRYMLFETNAGEQVIGFIDISFEQNFIQGQIINYTLIGLGSIAAFFLISLFLSKLAITPVERAWKKQQQFIADASHELKTPITIMLANTSILLSDKEMPEAESKKWLTHIDAEAQHMKKLVEDLLFLARIDGKDNIIPQMRLDLSDMTQQSSLSFEPLLFESGKDLITEIIPGIFINGNQIQIRQLLSILLDNAYKYGYPDTKVSIRLKKESNKAVLTVNNMGDPIDAKDIPHLFDRFYRVDKARTRNANSYGLGLAIAKEIVKVHKGNISVVSNTKEGITFKVILSIED